ncbi:MAG: hypothetical protein EZS28_053589 [Streblomastix strix]|uniref:Uncharacterized protein n=1 Tax=Streblomastix strix TaxID=222440 RepID=A0A5J4R7M0_9EUKA|nr:MAG: hypothetical protein EZS28_053589 [Streblomastix strix]
MTSNDTNGYDQVKTIELNQQERRCQNLRILKIPYSTGPRGVVQIDFSVKDVQILNCQFESIMRYSLEGIALRIQNFTDTPPIIPPLILPLPHPEPDTSINITINST